jgi:hypothetical protein
MVVMAYAVAGAPTVLVRADTLASHGWKHPALFWVVVAGAVVIGVLVYLVRNDGRWWK